VEPRRDASKEARRFGRPPYRPIPLQLPIVEERRFSTLEEPYRPIPAATATVEERRFSAAFGGFDMGFSPRGRCLPSKDDHQG
jgi:hypothetical protein